MWIIICLPRWPLRANCLLHIILLIRHFSRVHSQMIYRTFFGCDLLMPAKLTFLQTSHCIYWLLSSVDSHMHDKDTFNYKLLIANITLIWLLSSVYPLVSAKLTFLHKLLIAFITLIRLLSSVDRHMHDKDTFIYKLLVADITLLRHLPSMNPPMLEKDIFLPTAYWRYHSDKTFASPSGRYQMIDIDIRMSWIVPIFLPVFDHLWECMDETDHHLLDLLD